MPSGGIQIASVWANCIEQEWRRYPGLGERMELWPSVVYPKRCLTAGWEDEMCQEMPSLPRTQTFCHYCYWSHLQLSLPAVPVYLRWSNNCFDVPNVDICSFITISDSRCAEASCLNFKNPSKPLIFHSVSESYLISISQASDLPNVACWLNFQSVLIVSP